MLQNAYLLAKIGADTAENDRILPKFCQKLATTLRVHYGARAPGPRGGPARGGAEPLLALPGARRRPRRGGRGETPRRLLLLLQYVVKEGMLEKKSEMDTCEQRKY